MSDEQKIAALREEIRRSGSETRDIRRWTAGCFGFPFLVASAIACNFGYWREGLIVLAAGVTASLVMGVAVACPIAALGRTVRRGRLHRKLAVLSPAQRADVLLPLRDERLGDTRKIVLRLRRELGLPTELAPAVAPSARGDEPSPAEPADGARA